MSELHMPDIPSEKPSNKRRALFALKIMLTISALWMVFQQAEMDKIYNYAQAMDLLYAGLGILVLNIGQVASGLRMRHYFAAAGLKFDRLFAVALYYTGMLLNLVLPGGIGGDGYKAYYIKKHFDFPWKSSLRCIISGRGSGLLWLVIFTLICGFLSEKITALPFSYILLSASLILVFPCYNFLAKHMLKESLSTQIKGSMYSSLVQGSVIVTVIFLLKALGYHGNIIEYMILFQIATIVSILPISVGGIGLREITFFKLAPLLSLDPELGVALSLTYFLANIFPSLLGAIALIFLNKIKLNNE